MAGEISIVSARRHRNRGKHAIKQQEHRQQPELNNPTYPDEMVGRAVVQEHDLGGSATELALIRTRGGNSPHLHSVPSRRTSHDNIAPRIPTLPIHGDEFSLPKPARRARRTLLVVVPLLLSAGLAVFFGMSFLDPQAGDGGRSWQQALWRSAVTPARLQIQAARGIWGEPLRIESSIAGLADDSYVIIKGLIPGMTFSAGAAIGADAWRVPASQFADTWVGPPTFFVGVVDLMVELHLADQSIVDQQPLHLEWAAATALGSDNPTSGRAEDVAAAPAPLDAAVTSTTDPAPPLESPDIPAPAPQTPAPVVVASAQPTALPPPATVRPSPSAPPAAQLSQEQIATLLERGNELMRSGDLAAARVVFRRAAESKDATAALALGSTYDPAFLRQLKAFGFAPDIEMALGWYEKAKTFGSQEADRRIQRLASRGPR
jgi:hypothetical protein